MLRPLLTLVVSFLFIIPSHAWEEDAKAQLEQWARSAPAGTIPFTQERHLSILPHPILSSGEILLEGNDVLLWRQISPIEVELRLTPKGIEGIGQNYGSDINATVAPLAQAITDVFSGKFERIGGLFDIRNDADMIVLIPHDGVLKRVMKHIELRGDQTLQSIRLVEHNDDATLITLHLGGVD